MKTLFRLVAMMLVAPGALACGPYFPCSYIVYGGVSLDTMPEPLFVFQCAEILERELGVARGEGSGYGRDNALFLRQTLDAELKDLGDAIDADVDTLLQYQELREALNRHATNGVDDTLFDFGPYGSLLERLPAEFVLYLRGAAAYHAGAYEAAILAFQELLGLPEDARRYRSTWAAYMIGKSLGETLPDQAAAYYERTRALADAGFVDTLGLAADSWNWQAHVDLGAGRYAEAIRAYTEAYRASGGDLMIVDSIKAACDSALSETMIDPGLVDDPLSRQIMTAWVLSRYRDDGPVARWLDALSVHPPENPTPGADHLAWAAYRLGEFDDAKAWLTHARTDSPWALWVEAKLALRDGRFDDAEIALASAHEGFGSRPDVPMNPTEFENYTAEELSAGELGILALRAGEFEAALDTLVETRFWGDAAYVAERLLSIDALQRHVDEESAVEAGAAVTEDDYGFPQRNVPLSLRHLLARRLAREGRWAEAAKYYPKSEQSENSWRRHLPEGGFEASAREVDALLRSGRDRGNDEEERARALIAAGEIIREWGFELMGTELGPDWVIESGNFDLGDWIGAEGSFAPGYTPSDEERAQLARTVPDNEHRFHYRYVAAALMWEAAELLPNNNVVAAEALYRGGQFIKHNAPEAADRFYKALVRRNPNLLIAKQADDLRWFPAEFTDVVLYTARDEPPFRKRDVAIILVLIGAVAVTVGVRRAYVPRARGTAV